MKTASTRTKTVKKEKPMPYWCGSCRKVPQRQDWNGHAIHQSSVSKVGDRNVFDYDQPEGHLRYEASSEFGHHSENRLVHGSADPGGLDAENRRS